MGRGWGEAFLRLPGLVSAFWDSEEPQGFHTLTEFVGTTIMELRGLIKCDNLLDNLCHSRCFVPERDTAGDDVEKGDGQGRPMVQLLCYHMPDTSCF